MRASRTAAASATADSDPVKPTVARQPWMITPVVISVTPSAACPQDPRLRVPVPAAQPPRPATCSGETELSRRLSAFRARLEPLRAAIKASLDTDGTADPRAARRARNEPVAVAGAPRAAVTAPRESTLLCLQQAARKLSRVAPEPGPRDSFKFR